MVAPLKRTVTRKARYMILAGIIVLLIIIRLILPHVVLYYANDKLAHMSGYYGHINSIQINLYRGAYTLNNFYLNRIDTTTKKKIRFFKSNSIDFSIEWRALFQGAIVGKLIINSPALIFTKDKVELSEVKKDTTDFRKLIKSFMPLRVNRFEIRNGSVNYVDSTSKPMVDVSLKKVYILAINLTNATHNKVLLPSVVSAQADVYEGTLNFNMKLNVLAKHPTFELDAQLKNTNLVLLNDFFKAYGKFDVSRGNFGLYSEMAAKDGSFIGYVKPVIKNLKVIGVQDRNANVFEKSWEALVGVVAFVFKNQSKNQLATKIPIEGKFSELKPNLFYAVWEVLKNAFVQALTSGIDNELNIHSVNTDKEKVLKPESHVTKKNES